MIKFFSEIDKDDIQIAGGKAANLGELTKAGFNVPNGLEFVFSILGFICCLMFVFCDLLLVIFHISSSLVYFFKFSFLISSLRVATKPLASRR